MEQLISPAAFQAILNGDVENVISATTPGGIERQEAVGQARLFKSADRLPRDINYPPGLPLSKITEKLGITFGAVVDKVFIQATLPAGWAIKPTPHSMWSNLLDDKGRKRASIFFKASFYDYNAHISFECRYAIRFHVDQEVNGVVMRVCQVVDNATNEVLWISDTADKKDFDMLDRNLDAAKKCINEKFPNNNDPFSYWND